MIKTVDFHIKELDNMKKYPKDIFYIGNIKLLKQKKISIVGSRKPNQYARQFTHEIASKLAKVGTYIVSGGAIGVDTIAHLAATPKHTIMVAATGLNKSYPTINKSLIQEIKEEGLILSQFPANEPSRRYNFPLRNEVIVALGDALIVTYADFNSGTLRSVEYALKMKKKIYVLPHRLNESYGTQKLLKKNLATAIYDVDDFIQEFTNTKQLQISQKDNFLEFCKTSPTYDEAVLKNASKVFEYELNGLIQVKHGKISIL